MSAVRTQIYLTEEQRRRIDELTDARGDSLAEIVRKALDRYLDEESEAVEAALGATFGADPEARSIDRDEWNRG